MTPCRRLDAPRYVSEHVHDRELVQLQRPRHWFRREEKLVHAPKRAFNLTSFIIIGRETKIISGKLKKHLALKHLMRSTVTRKNCQFRNKIARIVGSRS